jgi:hypothetical protein
MKKTLLLSALGIVFSQFLFSQELDWAYSFKHSSVQNYATAIAGNGTHFVIAASVANGINADVVNGNGSYTAAGNFLAKYDVNAGIQWTIEQPNGGFTQNVFMDTDGSVYATGNFWGTVDFDPTSGTGNYTSGGDDSYLQKLDASGNLVWVAHTTTGGISYRIAKKSNGNMIIAGRIQDGSTVATLENGNTVTLEKGVFILEISSSGDVIGAYNLPTPSSFSTQLALAVDNNDNVLLATQVDGAMDLDLGAGTISDASNSAYDAVLVKYNSSFQYQWHKVFGDVPQGQPGGWDALTGIETDASGNIYATGYFTWTADFDPDDNPGTYQLTAGTGSQTPDGFIIKYNPQGQIQWVTDAGTHPGITGNTDVSFLDIILKNDNIIVSGTLNGGADFDGSSNDFLLQTFDNGLSLCYAHYSTSGQFQNAWLIDGIVSANESHRGIEPLGNGFVAYGTFQKKCDMDPESGTYLLYTDSLGQYYSADNDVFIARYDITGETGINEPTQMNSSLVYPNPSANGLFYFSQPADTNEQISIYDLTGRLVAEQTADKMVSLANQPAGVYILRFASSTSQPLRLIKL